MKIICCAQTKCRFNMSGRCTRNLVSLDKQGVCLFNELCTDDKITQDMCTQPTPVKPLMKG